METATGRLLARHSIRQTLKTVGESDEDGSASATSHSSHAQAGNNHPVLTGPTTLREVLLQIPGVCAFPPWAVTYYALSVLTHAVSAKLCKKSGKAIAPQGTPKEEEHVQFVYWLAVAVFTCVVVMQFAFMVFQISAKKRLLGSLVMFIQLCALITYLSHIYGWIGPISDPGGKEIQITRWLEWMSTTPVMLLVIAAVGNSMRTSLVQSWADTFKMLVLDEIMLLFGLLHSISNNAPWGICCLGLAIVCFIFVFQFIRKVMATSVANAATTYEVYSMRGLEWCTYVCWLFFPAVHALYYTGQIDWLEYEVATTFIDVLTKAVYSVTLLTGNFCILDVISTLRIAQMQSQHDSKVKSVIKAEAMNEALQTSVLEAEATARLTRRFLANISHELRTPLNSIIAFNTLIVEDDDTRCTSSSHKEYSLSALTSAEALLGIITQVLDFSSLENQESLTNTISLHFEPFQLSDVVDQLSDIVASRVNLRKVDFAIICSEGLSRQHGSDWFYGDSFRLRQALVNLCDNGIKFSKEEGGEVTVRIDCKQEDGAEEFSFVITDNGAGIDPEKQYLLFKPFSQVDSELSRKHGGTGLGLAITKSIINAMNGDIGCSSEGANTGCSFRVQMPARRVAADQIPQAEAGKGSTASVAGMRLRLCIPRGPSQESLLVTLAAWGVEVQDLSFDGMLPPPSTVTNLINLMAKDDAEGLGKKLPSTNHLDLLFQGKGLVRPIYLVDSCVWRACKQAGVSSDVLSRTMGHVLGFLDEQDKICKDVRAYAAWSALVRPIKKSTLRQKLASASETPQQEASSPQQQPGTPTSSCYCKAEQTGGEAAKSGKRKILIVDDHAVNQKVALRMIQKILGNDNVVADVANDGFEAVTLVTKSDGRPYDLVLMDVQMPGCDGLEATRRIRAWENETNQKPHYICALTAHANQSDVDECIRYGMDKYLSKPVNLQDLRDLLQRA